jgi:hypothetical protein
VGWEKKVTGIEIRFVEKPGFTDHGPSMVNGVVYMMRPRFWDGLDAHTFARVLLHEVQHAIDYRTGVLFERTQETVERRARRVESLATPRLVRKLVKDCNLEVQIG